MRRFLYAGGLAFAFALGTVVSPLASSAANDRPDLATFWRAWDLAHEHFVYRDALVDAKLVQGAIKGMVEALGDDGHTRYLSPEDVRLERSSLRGRFDGIGAEVNVKNGRPVIVAPIEDSPAEKAGLRPGDSILKVDGEDVTSLSLSELVQKVRGPRGSAIKLTVNRLNETGSREVTIVRDEVKVRSVSWAMVPGTTVAHLRINRFASDTTDGVKESVAAARAAGASALVVDLRNNPGGLLYQAVSTTSQFLSEGNVLLEEDAKGVRKDFPVAKDGIARDLPVAVLINRGSASASEIVAGALQDHGRGVVVGERSFGTGTVLTPHDLPDGSQLYLGAAQWLTPDGRAIRKVGIKPDRPIDLTGDTQPLSPRDERGMSVDDFMKRNDQQLMTAVEALSAVLPLPERLAPAA